MAPAPSSTAAAAPQDAHNARRPLQELRLFHSQFPEAVITPGHDPEFYEALDSVCR